MTQASKMRLGFLGLALALAIAAAFTVMNANAPRTDDAACDRVVNAAPSDLVLTPEIYSYLKDLDAANCPLMVPGALDHIVETSQLNPVSYVLLEARLAADEPALASTMIAQFLEGFEQSQVELDESAVLTLIDMAFYGCAGAEPCVAERLAQWTDGRRIKPGAACLFGMTQLCTAPGAIALLNTASLNAMANEIYDTARDEFICARYKNCK